MIIWISPKFSGGGDALVRVGERAMWRSFVMTQDRKDDSPLVDLHVEVRDGVPQCRAVTVRSRESGREVQSADLRDVRVEDLLEQGSVQAAMAIQESDQPGVTVLTPIRGREAARAVRHAARQLRAEARRKVTPALLREVATIYRSATDGRPTQAVAQHFGVAHRTAALYVKRARAAGELGPALRGRGGEQS